jgi:hypothetical protein
VKQEPPPPAATPVINLNSTSIDSRISTPKSATDQTPRATPDTMLDKTSGASTVETRSVSSPPMASPPPSSVPASLSLTSAAKSHTHGQDSPVMNETLSVIDEHITDMSTPHQSVGGEHRRGNDSGSEYSSHIGQRMSYINGEETDEEEDLQNHHTREEVLSWNADQVAEYLFTSGVESVHCEVFRDQEISGDVLMGMDQTSVFLKEFELGSVGRRLKTWQKIKTLQDEVGTETPSRRNTATYGSEVGLDDAGRNRSRSEASTTMLPRAPSVLDRPTSRQNSRISSQQQHLTRADTLKGASIPPKTTQESTRPTVEQRPSAASVRDLHHSRQNSGADFSTVSLTSSAPGNVAASPGLPVPEGHRKQPSFDRNWTMGNAPSPPLSTPLPSRPLSASGFQSIARSSTDHLSKSTTQSTAFDVLDRGYFSGGDVEGKQRNVLRKRTTSQGTYHSRNSSYTEEQRMRSATANTRHSRLGSMDSVRASPSLSAAQKYHGVSVKGRRRTPSESSGSALTPPRPPPPPKDVVSPMASPTVTKLENNIPEKQKSMNGSGWTLPARPEKTRSFGLRAISDAVTGHEKSKYTPASDLLPSPIKESPLQSPSTMTGSSTPSGGPSFDLDSPESKSSTMMALPLKARKKSKQETSAYTRGLEKRGPREQMVGADYSGWMKKKSSNLMTTWKPRLFILKGRRLSYYYSEDDTEEKGLIDISFHKVLPANNEILAGLHATLTGATNSPTSPGMSTESGGSKPEADSTPGKKAGDQMFIFKLIPPKAGLSRAVNFTKPTVHYFAVPNLEQGRLWMAALMKATIERDDRVPLVMSYSQKTISLAKARAMRHRPPALMNLDEKVDEEAMKTPDSDTHGLNIQGIIYDQDSNEDSHQDSGVSGISRTENSQAESAGLMNGHMTMQSLSSDPRTA